MEVSYYWIDNFSNIIVEQGYNFGSQLIFNFDHQKKELMIMENESYVKGFFNFKTNQQIKNLTAVVGKNGVGKSTFLKAFKGLFMDGGLLATKSDDAAPYYYKRILVIKVENTYKVFFHNNLISNDYGSLNVKYHNNKIEREYEIQFISYGSGENVHNFKHKFLRVDGTEILASTSCTYFSHAFDNNFYYESSMEDRRYFDISTKGLLNEVEKTFKPSNTFSSTGPNHLHMKDERFNVGLLKEFYINENKKRINLLSHKRSRDIIKKHSFFPEKIYLNLDYIIYRQDNFNFFDIDKSQLLRVEKSSKDLNKIEKYIYNYIENMHKSKHLSNYERSLILAKQTYLRRITDSYFEDVDRFVFFKAKILALKDSFENVDERELREKNLIQLLKFFLQSTIKTLRKMPKDNELDKGLNEIQFEELTNSYLEFINFFTEEFLNDSSIFQLRNGNIDFVTTHSDGQSLGSRDIRIIEIPLNIQGIKLVEIFLKYYESINTASNFIKFQWTGLSTGEDTLLSIYSRFFALKNLDLGENTVILLDEVEHSLHPEWQRRLLNNLIEYFPYVFSKCQNIQIVLASNVPFLIADIPTQNIVYLEKSKDREKGKAKVSSNPKLINQTFAANIHNLLIHNFFMESTIGEFSARKIEEIIKILKTKNLKESHYSQQQIRNIIQNIGEPIIKNKLNSMYIEMFGETTRENEISKIIEEFKNSPEYSPEKINSLLNLILSKSAKDAKYD